MDVELLIAFGHTLRRVRLEQGISQERFADLSDLHRTYISDIELGKRNVSLENIGKISEALNMKISELFREVENDASL